MRPMIVLGMVCVLALSAACAGTTATPGGGQAYPEPTSPAPTATNNSAAYPVPTVEATAAETPASGSAIEKTFAIVPEQTVASYSIDEIFINQNNTLATAIGKTSTVQGELTLNYADPTASSFGEFVVDISTLKSDRDRRDSAIRRDWLESAKFPLAKFTVTEMRDFPANPQEGQPLTFKLVGDMLIKETTHEVTWDVTATLSGDTLTGTATTFIMLADFNVPVPNIAGMLKVTDGATVTLDFTFKAK